MWIMCGNDITFTNLAVLNLGQMVNQNDIIRMERGNHGIADANHGFKCFTAYSQYSTECADTRGHPLAQHVFFARNRKKQNFKKSLRPSCPYLSFFVLLEYLLMTRKGNPVGGAEPKAEHPLQAVVIADAAEVRFRPMSLVKPRVGRST
jgi:hypothetical protein